MQEYHGPGFWLPQKADGSFVLDQKTWEKVKENLLEKAIQVSGDEQSKWGNLICPIALDIFLHPIKIGSHTFETLCIEFLLHAGQGEADHPLTKAKFQASDITIDFERKKVVSDFITEYFKNYVSNSMKSISRANQNRIVKAMKARWYKERKDEETSEKYKFIYKHNKAAGVALNIKENLSRLTQENLYRRGPHIHNIMTIALRDIFKNLKNTFTPNQRLLIFQAMGEEEFILEDIGHIYGLVSALSFLRGNQEAQEKVYQTIKQHISPLVNVIKRDGLIIFFNHAIVEDIFTPKQRLEIFEALGGVATALENIHEAEDAFILLTFLAGNPQVTDQIYQAIGVVQLAQLINKKQSLSINLLLQMLNALNVEQCRQLLPKINVHLLFGALLGSELDDMSNLLSKSRDTDRVSRPSHHAHEKLNLLISVIEGYPQFSVFLNNTAQFFRDHDNHTALEKQLSFLSSHMPSMKRLPRGFNLFSPADLVSMITIENMEDIGKIKYLNAEQLSLMTLEQRSSLIRLLSEDMEGFMSVCGDPNLYWNILNAALNKDLQGPISLPSLTETAKFLGILHMAKGEQCDRLYANMKENLVRLRLNQDLSNKTLANWFEKNILKYFSKENRDDFHAYLAQQAHATKRHRF
jgi:hypothetical protein